MGLICFGARDGKQPTFTLLDEWPFDELLVAYRDRTASLDRAYNGLIVPGGNGIFNPIVVYDGRVVGTWKRVLKADRALLRLSPFQPWNDSQAQALPAGVAHYQRFLGLPVMLDDRTGQATADSYSSGQNRCA